ncbi:MAG TPA: hypothetical protein VFR31_02860 [Thermoanaerobaculia bacterium]|nr:hypothetical protein [Thermoanaerobaculia bacterium]
MAPKVPENDKTKQIAPYRGAIELMQVGSVLLIPVALLLHSIDSDWTLAAWALAGTLFLWPFGLTLVKGRRAMRAKAEGAALRSLKAKPSGRGLAVEPYHSRHEDAEVYHIFEDCYVGNDIEPENLTPGDGGKTLCKVCEGMTRGKEKPAA